MARDSGFMQRLALALTILVGIVALVLGIVGLAQLVGPHDSGKPIRQISVVVENATVHPGGNVALNLTSETARDQVTMNTSAQFENLDGGPSVPIADDVPFPLAAGKHSQRILFALPDDTALGRYRLVADGTVTKVSGGKTTVEQTVSVRSNAFEVTP